MYVFKYILYIFYGLIIILYIKLYKDIFVINLSNAEKNDLIEVYDVLLLEYNQQKFFKRMISSFYRIFFRS